MKFQPVLLLFLIFALPSFAQTTDQKFKLGLKGGFSISSFNNDIDLADNPELLYSGFKRSSRGSFSGGFTVDYELSKRMLLGAELNIGTRGMSYRQQNTNIPVTIDQGQQKRSYNYINYNLDYLELPITAGLNLLKEESKSMLFVYGGIAPAVLINDTRRIKYDKDASARDNSTQDLPYTKPFINNVLAGVKLLEKETFGLDSYVDLRGNFSLSKVFNRDLNDAGKNLNTYMNTFTLSIGVRLL